MVFSGFGAPFLLYEVIESIYSNNPPKSLPRGKSSQTAVRKTARTALAGNSALDPTQIHHFRAEILIRLQLLFPGERRLRRSSSRIPLGFSGKHGFSEGKSDCYRHPPVSGSFTGGKDANRSLPPASLFVALRNRNPDS
jgi:hypothetical protein